jgi:hypothetical protein
VMPTCFGSTARRPCAPPPNPQVKMRRGRLSTLLARGREPRRRVKWYWGQASLRRHATLMKPRSRLVLDPAGRVGLRGEASDLLWRAIREHSAHVRFTLSVTMP